MQLSLPLMLLDLWRGLTFQYFKPTKNVIIVLDRNTWNHITAFKIVFTLLLCIKYSDPIRIIFKKTCLAIDVSPQVLSSVGWGCRIPRLHLCSGVRWWNFSNAEALGMVLYNFIALTPRSILAQYGSAWSGPIHGSNRTKLCIYVKLNYLK